MARLEYEITGNISGLASAANQVTGILNNLQNTADQLKIKLFSADTESQINSIGGALQIVNGKIQEYLNNALKGSQAFKDQQAQTALDNLAVKLQVVNGNAQLFGDSIKNNQQAISAYQSAINSLLSSGFGPLDSRVVELKSHIDDLNEAIEKQKADSQPVQIIDPRTPGLIEEVEARIKELGTSLRTAGSAGEINELNQQLNFAKQELVDLRNIGNTTSQAVTATGRSATAAAGGFNTFGLQLGYIIQDAPYAAQNFGAIGNNIAQLAPAFGQFSAQVRGAVEAEGLALTTGNLFRQGLTNLFTGISGITIAISLAVTAFTFYQQIQQKNAREAQNQVNALQQQKQALDDYIQTLSASYQVQALASANYAKEVIELDNLYQALVRNSQARLGNSTALEELQKKWPEEFGNLQRGTGFVNDLSAAYDKLRTNLIAVGTAQAAQKLAADAQEDLVKNTVALAGATDTAKQNYAQLLNLQKQQKALEDARDKGVTTNSQGLDIEVAISNLIVQENDLYATIQKNVEEQKKYQDATTNATKSINAYNKAALAAQVTANNTSVQRGRIEALQAEIDTLSKLRDALGTTGGLSAEQDEKRIQYNGQIKSDEDEIRRLRGEENTETVRGLTQELSLRQQIDNILAKGLNSANASGLSQYAGEVQKINALYDDLNRQLDQVNAKINAQVKLFTATGGKRGISPATGQADAAAITTGKTQLGAGQQKQLDDAAIAEQQRTQSEIQRINDEFGVKAQQSKEAELAANDKLANDEIAKAQKDVRTTAQLFDQLQENIALAGGDPDKIKEAVAIFNAQSQAAQDANDKITAIENGRLTAIDAINAKYLQKEQELQDSIQQIEQQGLDTFGDKESQRTAQIEREWDKRKLAASKYFDELRKVNPQNTDTINAQQNQVNAVLDQAKFKQVSEELSRDFAQAMQQGIKSFADTLYSTLTTLGATRLSIDQKYQQQIDQAQDASTVRQLENQRQLEQSATTSFGAIFNSITSSLFSSFNKSILDSFTKKLTENIGDTLIKAPGQDATAQAFSTTVTSAGTSFYSTILAAANAFAQANGLAGVQTVDAATDAGKSISGAGQGLSKSVATAASLLSVAGSLISGATSPTSTVGQGIGGALQGAGEGALIGSIVPGIGTAVGAVVGGIFGAVGGIFGASKAKKQQELQQQQLEEQQKTNAILQRTQALAYTSSIIGRMTDQGIITSTDINSFGQLTATVSGKDLKFVLDRGGSR